MTHLTDEQLVDAADGAPGLSAHLAHCRTCAEKVEALRRTLAVVRSDDAPEPSPLFWDGFAARVGSAIDAPVSQAPARLFATWRWALIAAALLVVVVGLQFAASRRGAPQEVTAVSQPAVATEAATADADDRGADEAWSIVESVAAGWHFDDASEAGLLPRPGSIEHAATELSPEERAELIRLIEDELKRTGA